MSYERKTADAKRVEDFWAVLDRPDDRTGRVMVVQSPVFATQPELFAWIKANTVVGDELQAWRRERTAGGFNDVSLTARVEFHRDPQRVAALLAKPRLGLAAVREPHRYRTSKDDQARAAEAAERLVKAGRDCRKDTP